MQLWNTAWTSKRSSEKIKLEVPSERYDNNCMMNEMKVEHGDIVSVAGQVWTQKVVFVDGDTFVGQDSQTGKLKQFNVNQVQV